MYHQPRRTLGALSLALVAICSVSALPITGSLDFSGGATLDGDNLGVVTKVVSWSMVRVTPGGVTPGSALDSTINDGDAVTMNSPWEFDSGLNQLWSVGGFTFDLVTSSIDFQSQFFLAVEGKGVISGNGFDPTPGSWFFTSQGQGIANGQFSFSATTIARPVSVPEGASTGGLLGLALAGGVLVGVWGRGGLRTKTS
ncbi:MAG: hypothetical protein U1F61_02115 [Opitutaceae bacterium]